ncbi:ABC transporter ATP-binding protein [Alkalibacillus haloalkaliphilus]|uniref:ABC transporter ATP-binding protein n=1 Tax=Alkalibacillus haloalkaliphilus TaxID=94136 RepID=UPI0003039BF0|nr:ABC transporter ATP-binding protein [Alkalibacillus haloalkaliphilus]
MLQLNNITYKKKNKMILNGISAEVKQGDSICLFGPNGAGKSTLLKVMAGLIEPNKGVYKQGNFTSKPVGYIPQQLALFPNMTVKDHLSFYKKMTKQKDREFIEAMLNALSLNEIKKKKVEELSGGMARKLNLAVGLIHKPDIIFLDEAFVGVDLAAKHDMLRWLSLLNEDGVTIVFITHDWHVIHHLAKTLWVLEDGQMLINFRLNSYRKKLRSTSSLTAH